MIPEEIFNKSGGFAHHYPFLYSIVIGMESKNVFEFGTGFSTHCILHALEKTKGSLTSCDIQHYSTNQSVSDYCKANENWTFCHGNSNSIFKDIKHSQYDLILHDGSHVGEEVLMDLHNIYPYLKHDGILLIHDTRHPEHGKNIMKAINEFNNDKASRNLDDLCTLPYGYGLTIFRNNENIENKINLTWSKVKKR
jgi:predicted O-methyltransferase YrrM